MKNIFLPNGVVSKKLIFEVIMLPNMLLCKKVEARRVVIERIAVANIIQIDWNNPRTPYTVRYLFLEEAKQNKKLRYERNKESTSNFKRGYNLAEHFSVVFCPPDAYICCC